MCVEQMLWAEVRQPPFASRHSRSVAQSLDLVRTRRARVLHTTTALVSKFLNRGHGFDIPSLHLTLTFLPVGVVIHSLRLREAGFALNYLPR